MATVARTSSVLRERAPYQFPFGFQRPPFPVTPDERHYFITSHNEQVLVELRHFVLMRKGFMTLTGDIGLGKTTLLRRLLGEFDPEAVNTSLVLSSFLRGDELLGAVVQDFGLPVKPDDSARVLLQRLNEFLLRECRQGRVNLLCIDDAQALDADALDTIRQLSNLETGDEKLLQILLSGQPELMEALSEYGLRQIQSRIAASFQMRPMSLHETGAYTAFRLEAALGKGAELPVNITVDGLRTLYAESAGYPRAVHHIMDRVLYLLSARHSVCIDSGVVTEACRDLGWEGAAGAWRHYLQPPSAAASLPAQDCGSRISAWILALSSSLLLLAVWLLLQPNRDWRAPTWLTDQAASTVAFVATGTASLFERVGFDTRGPATVSAAGPRLSSGAPAAAPESVYREPLPAPADWPRLSARLPYLNNVDWPEVRSVAQLTSTLSARLAAHGMQAVTLPAPSPVACAPYPLVALDSQEASGSARVLTFVPAGIPVAPVPIYAPRGDITAVQEFLVWHGHLQSGGVDGLMGAQTASALARYQRDNGLLATGQWDPETAYRLACAMWQRAGPDVTGV